MRLNNLVAKEEGFSAAQGTRRDVWLETSRGTQSSWLNYLERPQDPFALLQGPSLCQHGY